MPYGCKHHRGIPGHSSSMHCVTRPTRRAYYLSNSNLAQSTCEQHEALCNARGGSIHEQWHPTGVIPGAICRDNYCPQTLAQQERTVNVLGELFDGGGRHASGQEVLAPWIHHVHDLMNFRLRGLRRQPVLPGGRRRWRGCLARGSRWTQYPAAEGSRASLKQNGLNSGQSFVNDVLRHRFLEAHVPCSPVQGLQLVAMHSALGVGASPH